MSDKLDLSITHERVRLRFSNIVQNEIKLWSKYIGLPICELFFCSFEIKSVIAVRLSDTLSKFLFRHSHSEPNGRFTKT